MKFGMQSFKMENDIALDPVTPAENAEVMVDAQEAQADINEVVQLTDAVEEYVSVSEDLDGVQAEAQEVIDSNPSEEVAEEAAVKLERDLNGILCRINGVATSSRFASGMLGSKRQENDFKMKGKKGLIAKTESISDMGKKVWEHIKAFFAKIWDFMKSLFERFTALFKSNKSVLEGLKKKLESEEDSKYDSIKKDAKESQQLTFYHKYGKVYASHISKMVDEYASRLDGYAEKVKNLDKDAVKVEVIEKKQIAETSLSDGDLEGLSKLKGFLGIGVTGEGVLGLACSVNGTTVKNETKVLKFKKGSFEKEKNLRDKLIEICEYGIDICVDLDSSLVKDAEKAFNDIKKEVQDAIDEVYDSKEEKGQGNNTPERKEFQKKAQKELTFMVSFFSKLVATMGQQPSHVITAVRNGMSMCEPAKK